MSQNKDSNFVEVIRVSSHRFARLLLRADEFLSLTRNPLVLETETGQQMAVSNCRSVTTGEIGPIRWLFIYGEGVRFRLITTNSHQFEELLTAIHSELIYEYLFEARSYAGKWRDFLSTDNYIWDAEFLKWRKENPTPQLILPHLCESLNIANQISEQFKLMTSEPFLKKELELHNSNYIDQVVHAIKEMALSGAKYYREAWNRFLARDHYIARCDVIQWEEENALPVLNIPPEAVELMIATDLNKDFDELIVSSSDKTRLIQLHNDEFLAKEELQAAELLSEFHLTKSQLRAVILNEDNNLIQAGAGTGKTTTIVARAAYLVRRQLCAADRMLVLAFNNKATDELKVRLVEIGLEDVRVMTFHAYGNRIVNKDGTKVGLLREAETGSLPRVIQSIIESLIQSDEDFRKAYIDFLLFWRYTVEPPQTFRSKVEYEDQLRNGDLRALSGDYLRSREEVLVANFLTANGVKFEYEKVYQPKLNGSSPFLYRPDFYLSDYDVYLEHFALDREGNAPDFMGGREYVEKAEGKRQLHLSHGTKLLESHSWQLYFPDRFAILTRTLQDAGVKLEKLDESTLLKLIEEKDGLAGSNLSKFITQFNSLMKNARLSSEQVAAAAERHRNSIRCKKFLSVQAPVFLNYSAFCQEKNSIDFDDMIYMAAKSLEISTSSEIWDHILVDEFQDCSRGRVAMLQHMRAKNRLARLYCVGDDWQSINEFAGSDVSCMTSFGEIFGETRHSILDETFRYGQSISEVSQKFIKCNPAQSKKSIAPSKTGSTEPVEIVFESRSSDGVYRILSELSELEFSWAPTIYVLARYNRHLAAERITDFRAKFGQSLNISEFTIHRSKGKEADFVIVDKVMRGISGFPNEREDDSLLELVRGSGESYRFAEERRIFYVALTRARKKTFIVTLAGEESSFVQELLKIGKPHVRRSGLAVEEEYKCAICENGILIPRTRKSNGALFFSCSSPMCSYTEQPCSNCGKGVRRRLGEGRTVCSVCSAEGEICPRCKKGVLLERVNKGNGNQFWGCSLYNIEDFECKYTRNIVR